MLLNNVKDYFIPKWSKIVFINEFKFYTLSN